MIPEIEFADKDIKKRFEAHYGDSREFTDGQIPYLRLKTTSGLNSATRQTSEAITL